MNNRQNNRVPYHKPICSECGSDPVLVGGEVIYPHRSDLYEKKFYKCSCSAYVGCHPNTDIALGNPCGPKTRKARNIAHQAIDPIWKNGPLSRNEVYRQLAQKLNIRREICHVAHMTAPEALKATQAAEEIGKEAS